MEATNTMISTGDLAEQHEELASRVSNLAVQVDQQSTLPSRFATAELRISELTEQLLSALARLAVMEERIDPTL